MFYNRWAQFSLQLNFFPFKIPLKVNVNKLHVNILLLSKQILFWKFEKSQIQIIRNIQNRIYVFTMVTPTLSNTKRHWWHWMKAQMCMNIVQLSSMCLCVCVIQILTLYVRPYSVYIIQGRRKNNKSTDKERDRKGQQQQ